MHNVELPYGKGTKRVSFPDRDRVTVRKPGGGEKDAPLSTSEIDRHLEDYLASEVQRCTSEPSPQLVLAIPDHTRDAAQAVFVERFVRMFRGCVTDRDGCLTILIGSGRHDAPHGDQMDRLVPADVRALDGVRTVVHDAFREDELRSTGGTVDGTPIQLNKRIFGASLLVLYGRVTFHYLAGFGGGAKMLCPGLGGDGSIRAVHRRTLRAGGAREERRVIGPGRYDGNPMQEAIRHVYRLLDHLPMSGVQCVGTENARPVSLFSGSVLESHRRAIEAYEREHLLEVDGGYDLLLLTPGGAPVDVDLIQSHKALQHTRELYDEETCVILFAACPDGFGADKLEAWLRRGDASRLRQDLQTSFEVYGRTAMALREITEDTQLLLVTDADVTRLRECGLSAYGSWMAARSEIEGKPPEGGGRDVLVLPDASSYLYSSSESLQE